LGKVSSVFGGNGRGGGEKTETFWARVVASFVA